MLADYKWGKFNRFIDVGGAHGSVLAALLGAHPQASGVLFDLPQVLLLHVRTLPCKSKPSHSTWLWPARVEFLAEQYSNTSVSFQQNVACGGVEYICQVFAGGKASAACMAAEVPRAASASRIRGRFLL